MFFKKKSPPSKGAAANSPAAPGPAPATQPPAKKQSGFKLPGFGKKKAEAPAAKPPAAPAGKPPGGKLEEGAKSKSKGFPLPLILIPLLLVGVVGGGYYGYTHFLKPAGDTAAPTATPASELDTALGNLSKNNSADSSLATPTKVKKKKNADTTSQDAQATDAAANSGAPPAQSQNTGSGIAVDSSSSCAGHPQFLDKLGLGSDAQFSVDESGTRGLFVTASSAEAGGAPTKYQHQSWNKAGYLGAFVIDHAGNLYVAPSPRTGPGVTAPKNQDRLYKVDSASGVLAPFVTLPSAAPPSAQNPYGVMGLAYDCDTNTLYVTTVTGSTPENPVGRVYKVDAASGQVTGQREALDGYGIAVVTGASGKQLYIGSPDDGQIRALALDAQGNFQGDPHTVATLPDPQRARQITFDSSGVMVVQAVAFSYSVNDVPVGSEIRFQYDAATDKWSQVP